MRFGPIIALVVLALMSATLLAAPAGAQTPTCQSAASDSDGDGWGWENNASCIVSDVNEGSSTSPAAIDQATRIECANDFDPDGDGFGWENNQSCAHRPQTPQNLQVRAQLFAPNLTLTWDAVPDAAGYVVFVNGEPVLETTSTSIETAPQNRGANYSVRAFRPAKTAFSHPSRPVQWNGESSVVAGTDDFAERGCRTGAPGQNNPAIELDIRNPLTYFVNINGDIFFEPTNVVGTNIVQIGASFVADCDAQFHEVTLFDNNGEVVTSLRSNDGRIDGVEFPVLRPTEDVAYSMIVRSFFHDGSTRSSILVFFVVEGK